MSWRGSASNGEIQTQRNVPNMNVPSINELLQYWRELEVVSDTARLDAELMLCDILQVDRTYLYTWSERLPTDEQVEKFLTHLARRKSGEPIAYILGQREFWSFMLEVNSSTLIPRPETELLVELALTLELAAKSSARDHIRVLDLGSGTGAISLALASERPNWSVLGVDINADAVELAIRNQKKIGMTNVEFLQSDWFSAIGTQAPLRGDCFDLIVSNPPYVAQSDPNLAVGDVRFEPRQALISGADGLDDIRKIIKDCNEYLLPGGWLILEHGYNQGASVRELFSIYLYENIKTERDLAELERVTMAMKRSC